MWEWSGAVLNTFNTECLNKLNVFMPIHVSSETRTIMITTGLR